MSERVWDYPRPPRVEESDRRVRVVLGGRVIADTTAAVRVLETSHPPAWYLPREAFVDVDLVPTGHTSYCEFKGEAAYFDLVTGEASAREAAWTYSVPSAGYERLTGMIAVYPGRADSCMVDEEVAAAQEGGFYGGWITSEIVGPFKGAPETTAW